MCADKPIYVEASQPTFNEMHKQKDIAEYRSTQMSVSHYSTLKWDFLLPFKENYWYPPKEIFWSAQQASHTSSDEFNKYKEVQACSQLLLNHTLH